MVQTVQLCYGVALFHGWAPRFLAPAVAPISKFQMITTFNTFTSDVAEDL